MEQQEQANEPQEPTRDEAEVDEALLMEQETDAEQAPEEDELSQLRARVRELEEQAYERERLGARVERECAEFEQVFPDVSLRAVPDEVWGQVHAGVPLSAAYALYEKKCQGRQCAYEAAQARCAAMPMGVAMAAGQEYFSPAQVRAMSPREVRENYDRIFESMRHWQ